MEDSKMRGEGWKGREEKGREGRFVSS